MEELSTAEVVEDAPAVSSAPAASSVVSSTAGPVVVKGYYDPAAPWPWWAWLGIGVAAGVALNRWR